MQEDMVDAAPLPPLAEEKAPGQKTGADASNIDSTPSDALPPGKLSAWGS